MQRDEDGDGPAGEANDVYVSQLRDVFDSCDLRSRGHLDRNELIDLCQKLQLGEQIDAILSELLGSRFADGKVTFDQFKVGFVNVLSNALDNASDYTESGMSDTDTFGGDQTPTSIPRESGRQMFSDTPDGNISHTSPYQSTPLKRQLPATRHGRLPRKMQKQLSGSRKRQQLSVDDDLNQDFVSAIDDFILEASCSSQEQEMLSGEESDALRRVWDDVAVGANGYIKLSQLKVVCDLIGMDDMDADELELLFGELDLNDDGLISFEEFVKGLFTPDEKVPSMSRTNSLQRIRKKGSLKRDSRLMAFVKEEDVSERSDVDILTCLDDNKNGLITSVDLHQFLIEKGLNKLSDSFEELHRDSFDRISLSDVSLLMISIINSTNNTSAEEVLKLMQIEASHLRNVMAASASEKNNLSRLVAKLETDNVSLVEEGEDQIRRKEQDTVEQSSHREKQFREKLSYAESQWQRERDEMGEAHQRERQQLDERVKQLRAEERKTKEKSQERQQEIVRLEEDVRDKTNELRKSNQKTTRLEIELEAADDLKEKLSLMEARQRESARERGEEIERVRDLEGRNKELRDQNDELQTHVERLSRSVDVVNRRNSLLSINSHDEEDDDAPTTLNRAGSIMSSYTKLHRGSAPSMRSSIDQGDDLTDAIDVANLYAANGSDMDELQFRLRDYEQTIERLQRELESSQRQYGEEKERSSEINCACSSEISGAKEKHAADVQATEARHKRDMDEATASLVKEMATLKADYGTRLRDMERARSHEISKNASSFESDRVTELDSSLRKEKRKMEQQFREEREELELAYRGDVTRLEERVVILETEVAEAELRHLSACAEQEHRFREDRAEQQRVWKQEKETLERKLKEQKMELTPRENADDLAKRELLKNLQAKKETEQQVEAMRLQCEQQVLELEEQHVVELRKLKNEHETEARAMKEKYEERMQNLTKQAADDVDERMALMRKLEREKDELTRKLEREKNELKGGFDKEKQKWKLEIDRVQRFTEEDQGQEKRDHSRELQLANASNEQQKKELMASLARNKELEGELRAFDLRAITFEREAEEVRTFQAEKQNMLNQIAELDLQLSSVREECEELQKNADNSSREKSTILENSVREITEQQHHIARMHDEKEAMRERLDRYIAGENETDSIKRGNVTLLKEKAELNRQLAGLKQLEERNMELRANSSRLEGRVTELERTSNEKAQLVVRLENELQRTRSKMQHEEALHIKELETQREKLELATTAAATERSRFEREIRELRGHVTSATEVSAQDGRLKEKIFAEARTEVSALNKQLDDKSRQIRSMTSSIKRLDAQLSDVTREKEDLEGRAAHVKEQLDESEARHAEQNTNQSTKSLRSDQLVTELYLENSDLMKALHQAETNQKAAERNALDLNEQKRALQRVVAKLCFASGMTAGQVT